METFAGPSSQTHWGRQGDGLRWSGLMTHLAAFALALSLFQVAGPTPGGTFIDDDGHVLEGGIEAIAAEGITFGCNPPLNDRYCPERVLTRAQMAAMVVRAEDLPATSTDAFIDDDGHVLEGAINRLAAAGITFGCNPPANNRFCPDDTVTRAQAAGFLARALSIPASSTNHFVDDNGHVLERAINRIADRGITLGCNPPANNRFCPNDGVTRAQIAGMLTRALGLTPMPPPPRAALAWATVVDGLEAPIQVLSPPGENRLLIAEQGGVVRIAQGGNLTGVFLDISDDVIFSGERGSSLDRAASGLPGRSASVRLVLGPSPIRRERRPHHLSGRVRHRPQSPDRLVPAHRAGCRSAVQQPQRRFSVLRPRWLSVSIPRRRGERQRPGWAGPQPEHLAREDDPDRCRRCPALCHPRR